MESAFNFISRILFLEIVNTTVLKHEYVKVNMYLVLKHTSTKCPDSSKDEVEFIKFFVAIRRSVLWREQDLQQVTQCLNHTDVYNWSYFLETDTKCVKACWHIFIKQNLQICFFRLHFSCVDPTLDVPVKSNCIKTIVFEILTTKTLHLPL